MPGPGGPNVSFAGTPPQATRAGAEDALSEQVLVAAFPDASPEVHVASLDTLIGTLTLQEASVMGRGEVSMGPKRTIPFTEVGSMDSEDGVVALIGHDNSTLVQLHMESHEDQQVWADAMRALIGGRGGGRGQEGDAEDMCMLQARSQQLQNRIGTLEAVGKRRDSQLQKMQKRVDGAMQMLAAVQDMCSQQRCVIDAQKVAITELRREAGEEAEDTEGDRPSQTECPAEAEPEAEAEEASGDQAREAAIAEGEAEIADKTKQMLALLQQADEMQRALHELQALQAEADTTPAPRETQAQEAPGPALASTTASTTASGAVIGNGTSEDADDGETDPEAVLSRLQELQAEKERYEGMVRSSQQEHEDLLHRLNEMRSLMSALGIPDDVGDDASD